MKLEPVHKLALEVLGWGALLALSIFVTLLFWPAVLMSIILLYLLTDKAGEFKIVWEVSRERE
jgi:hypothetical protein